MHELQDFGVEADVWKVEGIDNSEDCQKIVQAARRAGRDKVSPDANTLLSVTDHRALPFSADEGARSCGLFSIIARGAEKLNIGNTSTTGPHERAIGESAVSGRPRCGSDWRVRIQWKRQRSLVSYEPPKGGRRTLAASKRVLALYVDRTTRGWIVRDSEGHF
jgi:hypothetical protein